MERLKILGPLLLMMIPLGCTYWQDDQGKSGVVADPFIPVRLGIAVTKEIKNPNITIEILEDSQCERITARDQFRFELTKKGSAAHADPIYQSFVSAKTLLIKKDDLANSMFEARLYHQDHPEQVTRREFNVGTNDVVISMKPPCLK